MKTRHASTVSFLAPAVAVLAITGLLAAACGGSVRASAFEVNGSATSQSDFDRELEALAANEGFVEIYEQSGNQATNSEGTVSAELAAAWATIRIQQDIVASAVEDEGLEVTDEDRESATSDAAGLFGVGPEGEEVFEAFPEWFREVVEERMAAQEAYLRFLDTTDEDEVREFYEENVTTLVEQCASGKFVSHILVETEDEAAEILAELEAGGAFDELAERSTEPNAAERAGFLDCFREGSYVEEFEAAVAGAEVDAVVGPVETQFGWHVIRIDATPPLEALRAQIEGSLGTQARQEAFQALLDGAEVSVDARYGTWVVDEAGARVEPPEREPDDEDDDDELPDLDDLEIPELEAPTPEP